MPRPLLDSVKNGHSFAASASRGPLRAALPLPSATRISPRCRLFSLFGGLGAEPPPREYRDLVRRYFLKLSEENPRPGGL